MDDLKSFFFGFLGLVTGLVFFVLFVGGVAVGISGRVLIRAVAPVAQGELLIRNNADLGTLNQEIGTILSNIGVGENTTISEDGLNRLAGAFLQELSATTPEFRPDSVQINLEPDRMQGIFGFTIVPPPIDEPFSEIQEIPLVLRFDLEVFQEGETLYFRVQELILGELTLPLGLASWLEDLGRQLIEVDADNPIKISSSGIQAAIPLSDINTELSEFATLRGLKVLKDELSVTIEPNAEFSNELVGQFRLMASENGNQGIRILDRYLDNQSLVNETRLVVQSLSALPTNPSSQQIQAIFWQSLNTLRGVAAEVGNLPETEAQALIRELQALFGTSTLPTELLGGTLQ